MRYLIVLVCALFPFLAKADHYDLKRCFESNRDLLFEDPMATLETLDVDFLVQNAFNNNGRLPDHEHQTAIEALVFILTDESNGHIVKDSFKRVRFIQEDRRNLVYGSLTITGGRAPGEYDFDVYFRPHECKAYNIVIGGQLFVLTRELQAEVAKRLPEAEKR